jgi:hypothetical protein
MLNTNAASNIRLIVTISNHPEKPNFLATLPQYFQCQQHKTHYNCCYPQEFNVCHLKSPQYYLCDHKRQYHCCCEQKLKPLLKCPTIRCHLNSTPINLHFYLVFTLFLPLTIC